jgi:hypothetical protein
MKRSSQPSKLQLRDGLHSNECAQYLKALADPERLRIIQCLQSGSKNVGELASLVGKDIVNVSHHLRVLRAARLVQFVRSGKHIIYSLHPDVCPPTNHDPAGASLDLGCCRLEWDS